MCIRDRDTLHTIFHGVTLAVVMMLALR